MTRDPRASAGDGLRQAVEALAEEWDTEGQSLIRHCHGPSDVYEGQVLQRCAHNLAALAAAHPEPGEAASVVVEWGVRYADGQVEGIRRRRTAEDRLATLHHNAYLPGISEWGAAQRDAALVRRTRIVTPDRVTDWEEVDE